MKQYNDHLQDSVHMFRSFVCWLQTSGKYWPDSTGDSLTYGPITITLVSVNEDHPNIRTKDITLTYGGQVYHFYYKLPYTQRF